LLCSHKIKKKVKEKMNLCYLAAGPYSPTAKRHRAVVSKFRADGFRVQCFQMLSHRVHVAAQAWTGFSSLAYTTHKSFVQSLHECLHQIPECDFIYIAEINAQEGLFAYPNASRLTRCGHSVCVPRKLRDAFMRSLRPQAQWIDEINRIKPDGGDCSTLSPEVPRQIEGEICLIGNGNLTKTQQKQIEGCKKTVCFNDAKNRLPGDRCDIHVLRQHKKYFTEPDQYPVSQHDGVSSVFLVGDNADRTSVLSEFVERRIPYQSFYDTSDQHVEIFKGCNTSYLGDHIRNNIADNASLGLIAISEFQKMPDVKHIHLYGFNFAFNHIHPYEFNFAFSGTQHSSKEADLVEQCCDKCILHTVSSNRYLPRPNLGYAELVLVVCLLLLALMVLSKWVTT
jgi:hypothetical protein